MRIQNIYEFNIGKDDIFKKIEENTQKDPAGVDVIESMQESVQTLKKIRAAKTKEDLENIAKKKDRNYMGFCKENSFVISYVSQSDRYITCLYGKVNHSDDGTKVHCECRESDAGGKIKKFYGFLFLLLGLYFGIDTLIKGNDLFLLGASIFFMVFGVMFSLSPKRQKEREEKLFAFFEKLFADNITSKRDEYVDALRSEKVESVEVEINWLRVVKGLTIAIVGVFMPIFVIPFLAIMKPYDTLTRVIIFILICSFSYTVVSLLGKTGSKKK